MGRSLDQFAGKSGRNTLIPANMNSCRRQKYVSTQRPGSSSRTTKYPKTIRMMGSSAAKEMRAEVHQKIKGGGLTTAPYFVETVVNSADGSRYWIDIYAPNVTTLVMIRMILG